MKNITILLFVLISTQSFSQNQVLLDENWFIQQTRNSDVSNFIWSNSTLTFEELRFELKFFSDKIVMEGCCGGVFEMDVNYLSNTELEILNLNEIETTNCNEPIVSGFYDAIKGSFTSLIGEIIVFNIQNTLEPGIKRVVFNHPSNSTFIEFLNTPNEINDQAQSPYWGHEPPNHQWSLTQVTYQGQTMELPYGAALTVADIFEASFTISLCGEIFVALNSSWYLDNENLEGPCFISCGMLENTAGSCEPIAGYDNTYLETFKQNAFNFLNDNIEPTSNPWENMQYEVTFGPNSNIDARSLIINDHTGNKLIFHSNENYLSTSENNLQAEISIYPNPAKETLHIRQKSNAYDTATMYDVQGKKVNRYALKNSLSTIDIKAFTQGLYFLVLESESGKREIQKFVKK